VQCTLTAAENARLAQEQNPGAKPFALEGKKAASCFFSLYSEAANFDAKINLCRLDFWKCAVCAST